MMRRLLSILIILMLLTGVFSASGRRRMTPVNTPATTTQSVNETATDTARINAKRRANSVSYLDDNGRTVFVDTITGEEWTDSTVINRVPKMEYPLFHALSAGVNIWDPMMRAFGQKHGLASAWVELSMHNRYKPVFEMGLGLADNTPSGSNFTYKSPLSVFFKIGANYNFLYNSNPDYSFYAGLRYGFSPFSFSVDNVTINDNYWGETTHFSIPSQHVTAGWLEFHLGLRVKIWGPVSAGWSVYFHSIIHESKGNHGKPWYIPGYGTRGMSLGGSFSISYTLGLSHMNKAAVPDVLNEDAAVPPPAPENGEATEAETVNPTE